MPWFKFYGIALSVSWPKIVVQMGWMPDQNYILGDFLFTLDRREPEM